jgi:hypothetical protein
MSNNKQSIKLYTEEQVREAWNTAFMQGMSIDSEIYEPVFFEDFLKELTPIELPSDEEIDEYVKSTGYYGHCTHEYHEGIEEGAKWMRDLIQGGNK